MHTCLQAASVPYISDSVSQTELWAVEHQHLGLLLAQGQSRMWSMSRSDLGLTLQSIEEPEHRQAQVRSPKSNQNQVSTLY